MKANIKWLDMPGVFRVNQVDAHSDHKFYQNENDYTQGENTLKQCMNGMWKFAYANNAAERVSNFYEMDFDSSGFDEIKVPQHIEMAGYDKIHYINTMYPWDGQIYRRPAFTKEGNLEEGMFSEATYNPVGSYLCHFDLEEGLKGKRVHISFEGVEQAMYLWLNGAFIGYAEDSFTVSEFDLTEHIKETGNILAVEVHKRSTAAFLEDQDFFRFFGIFRDVNLYALPEVHIDDMWVKPSYCPEEESGKVEVSLKLSGKEMAGTVTLSMMDGDTICWEDTMPVDGAMEASYTMPEKVVMWSSENPYLYTFVAKIFDKDENLLEVAPYKTGFRKVEMKNKVMYVNGKRLVIKGVNRHEWSARGGRSITTEEELQDMKIIKDNNINAVRTCHYPDRISWYYLGDESGVYIMAETNLESHGSWQKMGAIEPSWNVPGNIPEWNDVVMDRARTNFETFKNHVSIIFWSLGNESYAGDCIARMNQFFKEKDDSRLVHYEGVFNNPAYKDRISDMESHMYTSPTNVKKYLDNEPQKPFILCEYMHDMGNSLGGLKDYMDLLDQYEMYQGGYIWDFIDQALWVVDEVTGEEVLRYGGDFDDRPSDNEFSGNGIVFANRMEKPAIQEVKYYYGLY